MNTTGVGIANPAQWLYQAVSMCSLLILSIGMLTAAENDPLENRRLFFTHEQRDALNRGRDLASRHEGISLHADYPPMTAPLEVEESSSKKLTKHDGNDKRAASGRGELALSKLSKGRGYLSFTGYLSGLRQKHLLVNGYPCKSLIVNSSGKWPDYSLLDCPQFADNRIELKLEHASSHLLVHQAGLPIRQLAVGEQL